MMKGIKQINHFKLYKELGKGINKTVYLAKDDRTDMLMIVKAFNNYKKLLQINPEALEVIKGVQKTHDNILKYLGKEKTSNNLYICVEYLNGGSLSNLLQAFKDKLNTALSEKEVQSIMKQLIEGFEFMEMNKMSHRDIGLRDILIHYPMPNKKNEELIGDSVQLFKSARYSLKIDWITINLEDNATICNMPINAPNQEGNKTNPRMRPALWSLGSIAFELLFGVHLNKRNGSKNSISISSEATTFIRTLLGTINHTQLTWKNIKELPFICNSRDSFHMKYYIDSILESLNSNDSINSEYYSFIDLQKNNKANEDKEQFEVIIDQNFMKKIENIPSNKDDYNDDEEEGKGEKWEVISVHSEVIECNDIESINIVNNYLNV